MSFSFRLVSDQSLIGSGVASVVAATSFAGEAVDGTTLLVATTLKGDTNLNFTVNFDDLLTLAAVERLGTVLEEALGQDAERVGPTGSARRFRGNVWVGRNVRHLRIGFGRLECPQQQGAGLDRQARFEHQGSVVVPVPGDRSPSLLPRLA